jgi:hypothetical protein
MTLDFVDGFDTADFAIELGLKFIDGFSAINLLNLYRVLFICHCLHLFKSPVISPWSFSGCHSALCNNVSTRFMRERIVPVGTPGTVAASSQDRLPHSTVIR